MKELKMSGKACGYRMNIECWTEPQLISTGGRVESPAIRQVKDLTDYEYSTGTASMAM